MRQWDVIHWLWEGEVNLKILFPWKRPSHLSALTHTLKGVCVPARGREGVCVKHILPSFWGQEHKHPRVCVCAHEGECGAWRKWFSNILLPPKGGEYHSLRHVLWLLAKWSSLMDLFCSRGERGVGSILHAQMFA
jgi:hypothetical protein